MTEVGLPTGLTNRCTVFIAWQFQEHILSSYICYNLHQLQSLARSVGKTSYTLISKNTIMECWGRGGEGSRLTTHSANCFHYHSNPCQDIGVQFMKLVTAIVIKCVGYQKLIWHTINQMSQT